MLSSPEAESNTLVKSTDRYIKRILPNDVNTQITYTGHRLKTIFQVKAKAAQIHKHDLVYCVKLPDQSSNQDYLGKTGLKIIDRTVDHNSKVHIY